PQRAAREYLRILHLAARRSEAEVEAALGRLLESGCVLSVAAVEEEMASSDKRGSVGSVSVGTVDLAWYDALLESKEGADGGGGGGWGVAGVSEGAAPAGVPVELRGAGAAGAAGVVELRAVPAGAGPTGVPAAAAAAHRASAAAVAAALGEELVGVGAEASAGQGGAAGAESAGGIVRGPSGERAGLRGARLGESATLVCERAGVGARGAEGAVLLDEPAGAGAVGREAGPEAGAAAEAAGELRGAGAGRPGLRAAVARGDGGAVHALGGALRAGQRDADEQPAVLGVGGDLQGRDDDGGGDRPAGASLRDRGVEHPPLPGGAGEEGEAEPDTGDG